MEIYEIDIIVVMIEFLFAFRNGRLLSLSLFLQFCLLRVVLMILSLECKLQCGVFVKFWYARYSVVYLLFGGRI